MSRSKNFWKPAMSVVTSAVLDSVTIVEKSISLRKIFHSIWLMKNRVVLRWKMSVSLWPQGGKVSSSSNLWKLNNKFGFNCKEIKFQSKQICLIVLRNPCLRKIRAATPSFPSPKTQNARFNWLAQKKKNIRFLLSKNKIINTPLPMISRKRNHNLRLKAKPQSAIKSWEKAPLEIKSLFRSRKKRKFWPIKRKLFQFLKDQFNIRGKASWFLMKLKWISRQVALRLRRALFDPATSWSRTDNQRKLLLLEWVLRHSKAQTTFPSLPNPNQSKSASLQNPALNSKNALSPRFSTSLNKNPSQWPRHQHVRTPPQKN